MSLTFAAFICDVDDLYQTNTVYEPESPLQCHLGTQLDVVFLKFWLQLQILKMKEIHQWRNTHFSALILCCDNHFIFVSDFRQLSCRIFRIFNIIFKYSLCIWYLHCLSHMNKFETKLKRLDEFILLPEYDLRDTCEELYPFEFSDIRQLQQYKRILFHSPLARQDPLLPRHTEVVQDITADICFFSHVTGILNDFLKFLLVFRIGEIYIM